MKIQFKSRAELEATDRAFLELAKETTQIIDEDEHEYEPGDPLYEIQRSIFYLKNGAENDPMKRYGFGYVQRETTHDVTIQFRDKSTLDDHLSRLTALEPEQILREYSDEQTLTGRHRKQSEKWVKELLEEVSNAVTTMRESTIKEAL